MDKSTLQNLSHLPTNFFFQIRDKLQKTRLQRTKLTFNHRISFDT